jgi:Tol biopolymer transport system component
MRKLAVSRAIAVLMLFAMLVFVSIVHAGSWSSLSCVTEPNFCCESSGTHVSISGDGSKIAFVTSIDNASHIFVINSDGTGLKQLTSNPEGVGLGGGYPSISGDGSKVAFAIDVSGNNPGDPPAREICVVNSDCSGFKQLTYKAGGDQMVSSNSPSISNDGSRIAFFHVDFNTWNRGIFVINSDGTGEKQVTEDFTEDFSMSGDGSKIAFLHGDEFDFQYFVINSDGTELTQLTHNSNNYEDMNNNFNPPSAPSISDDGNKVAFEGYVGEDREIFVINSDGTGLKQLTDNAEDDWSPSISGDSSRIAFQRTEYRNVAAYAYVESENKPLRPQVFVINFDGTGLTQLTNDSERDFWFPTISYNGERIAFWNYFCSSESEGDYKSDNYVSLVSYLSDVEDENGVKSAFPTEIVIGGIISGFVLCIIAFIYLKRKERYKI